MLSDTAIRCRRSIICGHRKTLLPTCARSSPKQCRSSQPIRNVVGNLEMAKAKEPRSEWRTHWNLRVLAAERGICTSRQLYKLLTPLGVAMSECQFRRIFTGQPMLLNMELLFPLCRVLQVKPNDLLTFVRTTKKASLTAVTGGKAASTPPRSGTAAEPVDGPPVPALPKGKWHDG